MLNRGKIVSNLLAGRVKLGNCRCAYNSTHFDFKIKVVSVIYYCWSSLCDFKKNCFPFSQIQGSIMTASLLQIVIGATGIIGCLVRYLGPLTIATTVTLIGVSLFEKSGSLSSAHWGIAAM